MFPDLAEANLYLGEEFQERWARHFQEVCCFLSRHLSMQRDDGYRISLCHLRQDLHEEPERGHRDRSSFGTFDAPGLIAEFNLRVGADESAKTAAGLAGELQIAGSRNDST